MAAALRFAAKRLCGGALERPPQAFITAAKKLATPARTSHHVVSSLRRPFSSATAEEPTANLIARGEEMKQELLHVVRQLDGRGAGDLVMKVENKRLIHLLGRAPGPVPYSADEFIENHMFKLVTGALVATGGILYLEAKFLFPHLDGYFQQQFSSGDAE